MKFYYGGQCKDEKTGDVIFDVQILGDEETPGEYGVIVYRFNPGKKKDLELFLGAAIEPIGSFKSLRVIGVDCPPDPEPDFKEDAECWDIQWATKSGKVIVTGIEKNGP